MKKLLLLFFFLLAFSQIVFAYSFNPFTGELDKTGSSGGGSGTPGGSDTQVQYNDGGSFAGDSGFTFLSTSNTLAVDTNTLYVDGSANMVGIGTVSPGATLDINGDLTVAQSLTTQEPIYVTNSSGQLKMEHSGGIGIITSSVGELNIVADDLLLNGSPINAGGDSIFQSDGTTISPNATVSGDFLVLDNDVTISKSGNVDLMINSTNHLVAGVTFKRDGAIYYDYRVKVDSGFFQIQYSDDDMATWNNVWQFDDGTFDARFFTDVQFDGDVTNSGNLNVGGGLIGTGAGDAHLTGNLSIENHLTVNGLIYAGVKDISLSGNLTLTSNQVRGHRVYIGSPSTVGLPVVAEGDNVAFKIINAVTASVKADGANKIFLDGTPLDNGDKITSTGTKGDLAVLEYFNGNWYGDTTSWTDGGP